MEGRAPPSVGCRPRNTTSGGTEQTRPTCRRVIPICQNASAQLLSSDLFSTSLEHEQEEPRQDIADVRTAVALDTGGTVFAYRVKDPERYGVVEFDEHHKVLSLEEKPQNPRFCFNIFFS